MQPTYVACLTPAGRGAIATLALRGPKAWEIVRQVVSKKQLPAVAIPNHVWLGRIGDEGAHDEVVIAARSDQNVEVHCHGGIEVVRMLERVFTSRGAVSCSWDETPEADDPLSAQAKIALARAMTLRTAGILLDQHQGALTLALRKIQSALAGHEEKVAIEGIEQILRYANVGLHLTRPWRVAIAGAPNVGKSTLINALAGFQRSIVSAIPGTTRDVVTTLVAIDGWPVELIDTAGWRESGDELERAGIHRGMEAIGQADLCLWLVDASQPAVPPAALRTVQYVVNKIDLPAMWDTHGLADAVSVSAKTGQGIDVLLTTIAQRLVPDPPPTGEAVPFSEDVIAALAAARQRAGEAGEILRNVLRCERETASG